jgi:hypothetical protein
VRPTFPRSRRLIARARDEGRASHRPVPSYDHDGHRDRVRRFEITPHAARRGIERGSGLGVHRWVAEEAIALLHWFRRLRIRWEVRNDIHQAFITLGCAVSAGDG